MCFIHIYTYLYFWNFVVLVFSGRLGGAVGGSLRYLFIPIRLLTLSSWQAPRMCQVITIIISSITIIINIINITIVTFITIVAIVTITTIVTIVYIMTMTMTMNMTMKSLWWLWPWPWSHYHDHCLTSSPLSDEYQKQVTRWPRRWLSTQTSAQLYLTPGKRNTFQSFIKILSSLFLFTNRGRTKINTFWFQGNAFSSIIDMVTGSVDNKYKYKCRQ